VRYTEERSTPKQTTTWTGRNSTSVKEISTCKIWVLIFVKKKKKKKLAEAYATKGKYLKRLDIKGRGRSGQRKKPFCHIVIKLKERGKVLSRTERIVKKFKKLTFRPKGVSRLY